MLLGLFDQRFGRWLIIVAMKKGQREREKKKSKAYVIKLNRRRINGSYIHFIDFMNATN